jgi:CheY-like chemotaxis protein
MNDSPQYRLGSYSVVGALKSWFQRGPAVKPLPSGFGVPFRAMPDQHHNSRLRVLVVDDNPENLRCASELLEQFGITPFLAEHGAEAVNLVCEGSFDMVLMDLQMPLMDGLTATSRIRSFESVNARRSTPVVAFSGAPVSRDVREGCGMNGVLVKPCTAEELEACMQQWCVGFQPWVAGTPGSMSFREESR